jgi:hypothetical protein
MQAEADPCTVEAIMYELRTHGLAALEAPSCRRRLSDLSARQVDAVIAKLIQLRGRPYCPGITDELFLALDRMRK